MTQESIVKALGELQAGFVANAMQILREALAQPEQERNFCPRCGKRTNDIHTCTPPHHSASR
jgi:hypothetical protein